MRGLGAQLGEEVGEDGVAAVAAGGALVLDDLALLFFLLLVEGKG